MIEEDLNVYPLYKEELDEVHYSESYKLLGETRNLRNESIENIQKWLDENPKINAQRDPKVILYFLRGAKFNLDKAKRKIKCFYRMRLERIEWFSNRDPLLPELDELLKLGCFLPLPDKDSENRTVVVIRTAAHNPRRHSQNNVFKISKMLLDLVIYLDESVSIYGVVAILDMKNVSLGHALQLNPALIQRSVQSWENYSCRPKRLEFVNSPTHVHVVLNVFRSFMTTKMKDRVVVTKGGSPNVNVRLPQELGGDPKLNYSDLTNYWREKAIEYREWFRLMEKYKSER